MAIPFIRSFPFDYGVPARLSARVRRVIARNPGPFTFTGTGVYLIGGADGVAIIDPGPDLPEHRAALLEALAGHTVCAVLVTHLHLDHSPLARPLADHFGAPLYGLPYAAAPQAADVTMEEGEDTAFRPDIVIADGQRVTGPDWTLRAFFTPGHTSNHVCYVLEEEQALFSGDHVMGWSTTVVSPPDGDMDAYLASLDRVAAAGFDRLYPTHGAPIDEPAPFLAAYRAHRLAREAQVLARLEAGDRTIPDMVRVMYADVNPGLHPAACHSVLAHMIALERRGAVRRASGDGVGAHWALARPGVL